MEPNRLPGQTRPQEPAVNSRKHSNTELASAAERFQSSSPEEIGGASPQSYIAVSAMAAIKTSSIDHFRVIKHVRNSFSAE